MAEDPDYGPAGFLNRRDPEGRMTFMQHLLELRRRLMAAVIAITVTTVGTLIFYEPVFDFLMRPVEEVNLNFRNDAELQRLLVLTRLDPALSRLLKTEKLEASVRKQVLDAIVDPEMRPTLDTLPISTELKRLALKSRPDMDAPVVRPIATDPLSTMLMLMKVAVWAGLVLSSPVVIYEIWAFISPGLRPNEKRAIRPVLAGGVLFFVAGAAFCYYVVFPFSIQFMVWLDVHLGFQPSYTPEDYIGLLITFMLLFGAVFEIPLVVAALARLGIVSTGFLLHYWRAVVLICFVLGALLSPGSDIMSMVLMSGTLLVLYLLSLGMAWFCYKQPK